MVRAEALRRGGQKRDAFVSAAVLDAWRLSHDSTDLAEVRRPQVSDHSQMDLSNATGQAKHSRVGRETRYTSEPTRSARKTSTIKMNFFFTERIPHRQTQ
jgi:hypothetical protein